MKMHKKAQMQGERTNGECCGREPLVGTLKGNTVRAICLSFMASVLCIAAQGQKYAPPTSDLGRQNLSRVAASASDIQKILLREIGLMVELKRWTAKDATDHGQIVSDADLTDDAIFERLAADIQFRAVATELLQKYGYLLPKLNPDSEFAQERALLVQERMKWLAKNQEEELARSRQSLQPNLEYANACDSQTESDCSHRQTRRSSQQGAGQQPMLTAPPAQNPPGDLANPRSPRGTDNPLERAQMMQASAGSASSDAPPDMSASENIGPEFAGNNSSEEPFEQRESTMPRQDLQVQGGADVFGGEATQVGDPEGIFQDVNRNRGRESNLRTASVLARVNEAQPVYERFQPKPMPAPAELVRTQSPYDNIPSLYDMYVQAVPRPTVPKRFGAGVFENGSRDSQLIPMDLPVGPEYVVGPGDGLSIDLWGGVSQRFYRTVDHEGRVSLPEVGPIQVSGRSLLDVQQNLQQILRTQFRDVSADVSLARLRTIRIYTVGDVANPGAYDISSLSTPLNALFAAAGPTPEGSLRILKHYRGGELIQTVDVYDLLLHGVKKNIQRLENGDTVQIPPIGAQVTVEGMVRRPAIYELNGEKSMASVLELAGGLLSTAALRHIEVQRIVAHDKRTMLSVDVPESEDMSGEAKILETFEIKDGDRIRIFPIAPYNQDAVYLEGHVIRPGRYSYRANMRVTDMIASFKDLLPEPSTQYAEIIRLNAPDFHPSVESFDLTDALSNPSQAPALQPMDTVRIFSRYDFMNPPTVSVWGDVRAPGTYRTSGQIHVSDAIHLAGGLGPDAETGDAQLFRYQPDGKMKILGVRLSQALAGDPTNNLLLEPRDRLLIHRNADAVNPATVYVRGEVAKPGRYPLTTNMRVGDLIRVGGGLQPSADTNEADLTHLGWLNDTQLEGQHEPIKISAALSGDSKSDPALHNGDVLTIRQLPGWNDLGATINVKGEVKHPGTYGIRPGEKLSSILQRAGGFQPDGYAYGAVLERVQVRELEAKEQNDMMQRVRDQQSQIALRAATDAKQKQANELALAQWQTTLDRLNLNPPLGRVAIRITSDIGRWKDSPADVSVRAGDTLVIPKKPSFVMVTGQVFNPTAVAYRPGKSAKWYLGQSGGPTQMAYKKGIFVIRADGSVIGSSDSMWSGSSLGAVLAPGDTVVVPEKALGGGVQWQNVFLSAQVASSIAGTALLAAHF